MSDSGNLGGVSFSKGGEASLLTGFIRGPKGAFGFVFSFGKNSFDLNIIVPLLKLIKYHHPSFKIYLLLFM